MGALHEGHAALIRLGAAVARERGWPGGCVVTNFVNPTQFNDQADFERYPRTVEADRVVCDRAGAEAVIVPALSTVYPDGAGAGVPELPTVATEPGLEDAQRPGHFAGVCQVVHRLFEIVRPDAALFGEKDWQQIQVVREMTRRLALGVEIIAGPTVREADGLAMSSRNRFLNAAERKRATALWIALGAAGTERDPDGAERAMRRVLAAESIVPDYAVVRDATSLARNRSDNRRSSVPMRALIAARVGTVRLLDNAAWPG